METVGDKGPYEASTERPLSEQDGDIVLHDTGLKRELRPRHLYVIWSFLVLL